MDKLKEQLAGVLKYGFWFFCALTVVGTLGIGFWSTSNLASERDAQISKIDKDKADMSTLQSSVSTHPNDATKAEMDLLIESLKEDVKESWTKQYARQKELLIWPVDELQQDFVDAFKDFVPIELTVEYPVPPEKQVEVGLLRRYRDYIGDVLPDIAKIAGTEWTADFKAAGAGGGGYGGMGMGGMGMGGMGMGGMGMGMGGMGDGDDMGSYGGTGSMGGIGGAGAAGLTLKDPPLVRWQTGSQDSLMSNLFPWRGRDPDTLDVLYSQENLWVLRQLMHVIAKVNGDAKQPFQAVIREINEIAIGKAASKLGGSAGASGGMGGMYGSGGADMYGSGGSEMGYGEDEGAGDMAGGSYGGGPAQSQSPDPADMRYVDVNYEPMDAATLRTKMASSSPDDAYTTVAKRIPVRMNLRIDQRKIPLLVAECGNADLMIEVRQIRINPTSSGLGGGMGMGMGMGGMGGGTGPGIGGLGAGGGASMDSGEGDMGGSGVGGGGAQGPAGEFPNDVTVEVSGIVYIYNPPDINKLGVEQVDENTLIQGDSETVAGQSIPTTPDSVDTSVTTPSNEIADESSDATNQNTQQSGSGSGAEVPEGTSGQSDSGSEANGMSDGAEQTEGNSSNASPDNLPGGTEAGGLSADSPTAN